MSAPSPRTSPGGRAVDGAVLVAGMAVHAAGRALDAARDVVSVAGVVAALVRLAARR